MKTNSVLSFENEKPSSVEVTVMLKPLSQAEVHMKCKSPTPQARCSQPGGGEEELRQQDKELTIRKQLKCIVDIS